MKAQYEAIQDFSDNLGRQRDTFLKLWRGMPFPIQEATRVNVLNNPILVISNSHHLRLDIINGWDILTIYSTCIQSCKAGFEEKKTTIESAGWEKQMIGGRHEKGEGQI